MKPNTVRRSKREQQYNHAGTTMQAHTHRHAQEYTQPRTNTASVSIGITLFSIAAQLNISVIRGQNTEITP